MNEKIVNKMKLVTVSHELRKVVTLHRPYLKRLHQKSTGKQKQKKV